MKRLLFVCVENSNRSQMAEAFARTHGGKKIEAFSAGSKPSGVINPKAIDAMRERGYNLSTHSSKSLTDIPDVEFDFVATMGCGDACPAVRGKIREDWNIPDPKHLPPQEFNQVRDLIERKVLEALRTIGVKQQFNPNRLMAEAESNVKRRLFTFASGGWVLLVTGLVCLAIVAWAVAPAIMRQMNRPPGDNVHIESYGFDLSNLQVPRELVVPAMLHRDMVPVMTNPTFSNAAEAQRVNDLKYAKYLVPGDIVIGVEIGGEARAYPIHVMYVHEIINDNLGGVPIAVTYHWPCDSTVVFDRRVNGETLQFRISGLVYNSNMLMYEKSDQPSAISHPPVTSSLWSQLLGRAVSGPLAGKELKTINAQLQRWDQWLADHPDTTVLNRDLRMAARYKDAAPVEYLQSEKLLFPSDPLPPAEGPTAKTHVVAVQAGMVRRVYPMTLLAQRVREAAAASREENPAPSWTDALGPVTVQFTFDRTMQTVRIEHDPAAEAIEFTHAYWFAWHAMHPQEELAGAGGG